MMGSTHLAAGIILSAALTSNPVGILAGGVASLLPDIDEPGSMLSRRIPVIPSLISVLGHRTITHSLLGLFLFSIPIFLFLKEYVLVFMFAYLSHLVLDTLTPMGVPWLWPVITKRFSLPVMRTGGIVEGIFVVTFLIGSYYLLR